MSNIRCAECGRRMDEPRWGGLCADCHTIWTADRQRRRESQDGDLAVDIRNAIAAEYGRQHGRAGALMLATEIDLDGIAFAVIAVIQQSKDGTTQ